ncbi:two-component regulator propeller domain-containing protein [Bacteroides sp. 224]|uniref:hybrid sensor histidine kinase/response regulator transcription factor n=1 Tax=Bacteroides sp. 224 TaxID=2302936 RepID=UPI0013D09967|nr:two-component regulator propeller domain-containing protein [Bacteroides sp. 224]NDV65796.1 response regulator [Bacteroides sp. 224]
MRILKYLSVIFFLFCYTQLCAHSFTICKPYQIEDGLSHNTVWHSIQDSYGFIWFATADGLNCYNGKTNKVYRNELNNPFSIESNYIRTLFELDNRNIWVGTGRGIYLYERKKDHFVYFDKRTEFGVSISSEISKIYRAPDGQLWIGTLGQGLFIYNPRTEELVQNSSQSGFICDIVGQSTGVIYIATMQDGLFSFDSRGKFLKKHTLIQDAGEKEEPKLTCLLNMGKNLWIGTNGKQLLKYNTENGSIESILVNSKGMKTIQSLMEYNANNLWIGTEDGLYEYDLSQKKVTELKHKNMSDTSVNFMMKDAESGVWILTSLGGANYIPKSTKRFYLFSPDYQDGSGASGKVVNTFCEDPSGNIWLGTRKGLYYFNTETYQLSHFPLQQNRNKNYDVRTLCLEGNKLWIGTYGAGLFVMNLHTKGIKHYIHSKDTPNTICSDDVLAVYQARSGTVYIGTSWGLCHYNHAEDNFMTISSVSMMVSVVDLHEDKLGRLWIATSNSGVFRQDFPRGDWIAFQHEVDNLSSIISNSISTLFEDSEGRMWFGTNGRGVCYFDNETGSFVDFDPKNNLIPNKVIDAIQEDETGNFWISGNAGLVKIHPKEKQTPREFTQSDGIQGNQFNFRSSLKASNGYLFFGGINGFNMFKPETFTDNDFIPPVYVIDISFPYLDDEKAGKDRIQTEAPLYMSRRVTLPYEQNSFSLTFASLSYEAPDNNRYSYILHGIDKDWIQNTEKNTVSYTDLPPGKYELEVLGSNNDYLWNEESTKLTIIITPPWWRSGIAYFLYIIIFLAFIAYLAWWWNAYIRKKYRRRMKDFQVTKEKEIYQSKINFFINLVHEIRTPLSLIKLPLEKLHEVQTNAAGSKYLSVIDKNVNYLLDIVNQLLDFQKMENGNVSFVCRPCNMNLLTEQIVAQFATLAELKGIDIQTVLPAKELTAVTDMDKIYKVLVNLLSNAVKHAKNRIEIKLFVAGADLYISVSDDGLGIPPAERDKVFEAFYQVKDKDKKSSITGTGIGLAFSKSLVEGLNGKLSLGESVWGGSVFTLTLPLEEVKALSEEKDVQEEIIQDISSEEVADHFALDKRKFCVLLVEDNIDLLNLTQESLSEWFHILKASNGNEALEVLAEESPDIIVSDVMMPDMDGMELCRRVKSDINTSHIPVILLTAKTNIEAKSEGFENGADAYLEKPFSIRQLRGQIENLLKLRQAYYKLMINLGIAPKTEVQDIISQKDYEFINSMKEAILEQMSDDSFSIEQLAESLNMSRSNFYRKVKALTGMPPIDYLKTVRLYKAAELLQQGVRIQDICGKVGFSSTSYFTKCFKAEFGVSPKEYK